MVMSKNKGNSFADIQGEIGSISKELHRTDLIHNAIYNKKYIQNNFRDIEPSSTGDVIVVGAGPSLIRNNSIPRILESNFSGIIVAVDASYIRCLNLGLIPDFVVTLDPHQTRLVRWFGDPNLEKNSLHDDYFNRQDLDINFRNNGNDVNNYNINLVNKLSKNTNLLISTSSPKNLVDRLMDVEFKKTFWWNPLVDDPYDEGSLTKILYNINKIPCMNTGGNVGTAAWVFADTYLNPKRIALVGMDFGYYEDLPYAKTQKYYELIERLDGDISEISNHFPKYIYPNTERMFYTDATYSWYKQNFLELVKYATVSVFNCTEGGVLFDDSLKTLSLDIFLKG